MKRGPTGDNLPEAKKLRDDKAVCVAELQPSEFFGDNVLYQVLEKSDVYELIISCILS